MTFSRQNPTGWSTGDQLTSAQINGIDLNQSLAVDGDAGGTYGPSSSITIDTGSTLAFATGSFLSVTGTEVINATGAVTLLGTISGVSGSEIAIGSGADLTIESGGLATVESGGDIGVGSGGDINLNSGGEIYAYSGSDITLGNGSNLTGNSGSNINISSGADIEIASGGDINVASGGSIVMGDVTDLSAATYSRTYNISPRYPDGVSGFTLESSYATHLYWLQTNSPTSADHFTISLPDIHRKATVTSITAHVKGKTVSRGSLPSTMPRLYFGNVSYLTGSLSVYDFADDPSGSVPAYEAYHTIPLTGLSQALDGSTTYPVVSIRGESGGAGGIGELQVFAIQVTVSYTTIECG